MQTTIRSQEAATVWPSCCFPLQIAYNFYCHGCRNSRLRALSLSSSSLDAAYMLQPSLSLARARSLSLLRLLRLLLRELLLFCPPCSRCFVALALRVWSHPHTPTSSSSFLFLYLIPFSLPLPLVLIVRCRLLLRLLLSPSSILRFFFFAHFSLSHSNLSREPLYIYACSYLSFSLCQIL